MVNEKVDVPQIENERKTTTTPYSVRLPDDLKADLSETVALYQKETQKPPAEFFREFLPVLKNQLNLRPARNELTDIEKAMKLITKAVEGLNSAIDQADEEKKENAHLWSIHLKDSEKSLTEANFQVAKLEEELKQSQKEAANVVSNCDKEKYELQREIKDLKAVAETIGEVREQVTTAREALKKAEKDRDSAIKQAEEDRTRQRLTEAANIDLRAKLESATVETNRVSAQLAEQKEVIRLVTEKLEGEKTTLSTKLESCNEIRNQYVGELTAIRPMAQNLAKELAENRHLLEKERLENLNLAQNIKLAEAKIAEFEQILADATQPK